jgi:hypothetical protein
VQRRRFLVNAVFTSAALPASALRWLTNPPRSSVVSYLDDHVCRLLTAGSYQEGTGRQLAAACGELSQLAALSFAEPVFA